MTNIQTVKQFESNLIGIIKHSYDMSKSQIKSFKDLISRIDWIKVLIFLSVIITVFVIFSCNEEEIKPAVGCECNDGRKLDFSMSINGTVFPDIFYEPKHCDGGQVYRSENGCNVQIMLSHGGLKRLIYNREEL